MRRGAAGEHHTSPPRPATPSRARRAFWLATCKPLIAISLVLPHAAYERTIGSDNGSDDKLFNCPSGVTALPGLHLAVPRGQRVQPPLGGACVV